MIGGGIGLGYELESPNSLRPQRLSEGRTLIKLAGNNGNAANLNGFLYPFDLLARFSLGVVF